MLDVNEIAGSEDSEGFFILYERCLRRSIFHYDAIERRHIASRTYDEKWSAGRLLLKRLLGSFSSLSVSSPTLVTVATNLRFSMPSMVCGPDTCRESLGAARVACQAKIVRLAGATRAAAESANIGG